MKSYTVFIYGTLLVDEIRQQALGRSCDCAPATLRGYRRVALSKRTYPGLLPDVEGSVDGLLCLGLTEDELADLDRFEGDEYERAEVTVETTKGAERVQAYLLSEKGRGVATGRNWDLERFRRRDLERFLREEGE